MTWTGDAGSRTILVVAGTSCLVVGFLAGWVSSSGPAGSGPPEDLSETAWAALREGSPLVRVARLAPLLEQLGPDDLSGVQAIYELAEHLERWQIRSQGGGRALVRPARGAANGETPRPEAPRADRYGRRA